MTDYSCRLLLPEAERSPILEQRDPVGAGWRPVCARPQVGGAGARLPRR